MKLKSVVAIACGLLCSAAACADNRVEFVGRVGDNQLGLADCPGNGPGACPWSHMRPGEYIHATFIVTGQGQNLVFPEDLVIHPNAQARGFDIVNGTYVVRAADVAFSVPVFGQLYDPGIPNSGTNPGLLFAHNYWTVDSILLSGAVLTRGGRCCYPNGSCTFVLPSDCTGSWTLEGACGPTNSCAQPNGVCCAVDNSCLVTSQAGCTGGVWTVGGACTPGACPQAAGACCEANGSCAITTQALCAATWTAEATCTATLCPWPALVGDYAMDIDHLAHEPANAFVSADISQNNGVFPGALWNVSRSWLIFYANQNLPYESFIDIERMVISSDTTPMGSCCPGDGHCLVTTLAACPISSSWQTGGSCGPSTCPSSSGACCKADGTCDLLTPAACATFANSVYRLDNSACSATICPPTGGCCVNGSCSVIIQTACNSTGGSWMGAGTTCVIAPQHTITLTTTAGACCSSVNGLCSIVYQTACTGATNTWTPGATCANPCPGSGACCLASGECRVVNPTNCASNSGAWTGEATCANPCFGSGSCCNSASGVCTVVVQAGCTGSMNTWTSGGTCAAACPGGGACCNAFDGSCTMRAQSLCSGTWNGGNFCAATPCTSAGSVLADATFQSSGTDIPAVSTFSQTITNPAIIQSVELRLSISETRLNDLKVQLTGPNGTTLPIFTRIGTKPPLCSVTPVGAGHSMLGTFVFLDSAPLSFYDYVTALPTGDAAAPGSYRAAGCGGTAVSLSAPSPSGFGGIVATGTWTLTITDERSGINATLYSWSLSFNGGNAGPCTIGHCVIGANCTVTTFNQCAGSWSIGPCSPVACSSGTPGACCFHGSCTVMCQSLCPTAAPNFAQFAGSGSTCTPSICNVACCLSSGACILANATNCGGTAGALGSTCSPNTCPQPVACCLANGACTMAFASACTGGTPGAIGSTCTPNTCSHPTSPVNDVCSAVLAGGPDVAPSGVWTASGATMVGATADSAIPACGSGVSTADVWWRFIPQNSGSYLISTCGNPVWDTTLSVWSSCSTQVPGACADDNCSTSPSSAVYGHESLTVALTANTPYLIRVGSFSPLTTNVGAFALSVNPVGACCNTIGVCTLTAQSACTGTRIFQGLFTACSPNPCPQPRACCSSNNVCSFITVAACPTASGSFTGPAGSTCTPSPCGFPAACCFPDGTCTFEVWQVCGGAAQAAGSTCEASPCPQPNGACCCGSHCSITAQIDCSGANQAFAGLGMVCTPFSFTAPCCRANFNKNSVGPAVSVQDIFDYLTGYFSNDICADANDTGTVSVQDIFDFLTAYFAGGC